MADLQEVTDAGYPGSLWWSATEYGELGRLFLLSVDSAPRPLRRAGVQDEDTTAANRRHEMSKEDVRVHILVKG
jgi:hypothetical protein